MITETLVDLGIDEFVVDGDPTTEEEFMSMFKKVIGEDKYGEAILSSNPDDFGVTWEQIQAQIETTRSNLSLKFLRHERDLLLAETDWWVLPDRTPTQEQLDYRQALRDITNTYSSLDDVVWPDKPE